MTDNDKTRVSDAPQSAAEVTADSSPPMPPPVPPVDDTPRLQSSQPPQHPPASSPPARRSGGLWLVLLLVLVAAMAAGGFWLWQEVQQRDAQVQDLQAQMAGSRDQLASLQEGVQQRVSSQLADVRTQSEAGEQALRQQVSALQRAQEQLREQLEGQQQRLASMSTTSREDWLLAEAEYLLKVANQRVLIERTTDNAVALLRSADERLLQASQGIGDAELFAIRKALSRDLSALEAIEPIDKEGVYLRLYALAERVDDLPRLQVEAFPALTDAAEVAEEKSTEQGWASRFWRGLRDLTGSLDRYVRIDDVEAPAKPLVDSYATRLAALNVRLLLEQAQLALMQEEPRVYRHSLEKAQVLLQDYYLASEQNTRLRASLEELAELNVAPELPDISGSLTLLRDYLRQLHRLQPAPKGQL